jgi:hypothetical protein
MHSLRARTQTLRVRKSIRNHVVNGNPYADTINDSERHSQRYITT